MIGHYLLTLTEEQEGRVLTRPMGEVVSIHGPADTPGCLLQVAADDVRNGWVRDGFQYEKAEIQRIGIGQRYDGLLKKHGVERLNAAIRNRILSNRARRTLQQELVRATQ